MSFRKSGHLIAAQALEAVESATTTLRIQNGKVELTDGPFGLGGEARMGRGNSTKSIPDQARQFLSGAKPTKRDGIDASGSSAVPAAAVARHQGARHGRLGLPPPRQTASAARRCSAAWRSAGVEGGGSEPVAVDEIPRFPLPSGEVARRGGSIETVLPSVATPP